MDVRTYRRFCREADLAEVNLELVDRGITVPATYNELQRRRTLEDRTAGLKPGEQVVTTINWTPSATPWWMEYLRKVAATATSVQLLADGVAILMVFLLWTDLIGGDKANDWLIPMIWITLIGSCAGLALLFLPDRWLGLLGFTPRSNRWLIAAIIFSVALEVGALIVLGTETGRNAKLISLSIALPALMIGDVLALIISNNRD